MTAFRHNTEANSQPHHQPLPLQSTSYLTETSWQLSDTTLRLIPNRWDILTGPIGLATMHTHKVALTHRHIIQVWVDVDVDLQILFLLSVWSYHCNNKFIQSRKFCHLEMAPKHTVMLLSVKLMCFLEGTKTYFMSLNSECCSLTKTKESTQNM